MNARARALVAALAATLLVRSPANAQNDGSIVWYTSVETPTIAAITERFNAGHPGLTLEAIRMGAPRVDAVPGDLGDLQPYRPPDAARFIKGALDPRGLSVAMYLTTIVMAWNPAALKREGLYRSSGYTVTVTQLEAGEVDATPTAYGYYVQSEKKLGRNVDFALFRPQLVDPAAITLVKDAPHPRAARIFPDWMLSKEGQQLIIDGSDRTSARTDVQNDRRVFNPALPYYVVPAEHKAEYDALVRRFNAFFGIAG